MIVAARSVHFASAMLLFGTLLLALAVAAPIWRGDATAFHGPRLLRLAVVCGAWTIAASIASGGLWLIAEGAIMSGTPVMDVLSDGTLSVVLTGTLFGRLWLWRGALVIALGLLLFAVARRHSRRSRLWLALAALVVSAAYLAALAWSGHAAAARANGDYAEIISDVVHLLAAGAWVGALPGLVFLLGSGQSLPASAEIVRRFSILGVLSVGLIVVSGLGNAWYLVGGIPALVGTDYGRVLLAKLALFAVMVALAAVNRLSLSRRLDRADASARSTLRSLRRNAALETAAGAIVVVIAAVLGVMVPGAHESPVWPFPYTLGWQAAQLSPFVGTAAIVAAIVCLLFACAALRCLLRGAVHRAVAALAALVVAAATCAWLLAVPAYSTTYAAAPVRYSTDVIAEGASLFAQNCAACHGPNGRGDGPLALSLPILPTDVAAHASGHRAGELYWWIAHGFPDSPMPAFAARLSGEQIWKLVQFLRAQSDAVEATTLTSRVQPWRSAIVAPDFTFDLGRRGQQSLRQPQAAGATLLVLYAAPQSLTYLQVLAAESANLGEVGLRVVAVPMSANAGLLNNVSGGEGGPLTAVARADVIAAFARLAREDGAAPDAVPTQADFLIDRQGYVRARWIGIADSPSSRIAEVFDQADLLRRERQRPPMSAAHLH